MVGIAGGSGSGKTTLAQAIYTALGKEDNVTFISHDSYYKGEELGGAKKGGGEAGRMSGQATEEAQKVHAAQEAHAAQEVHAAQEAQ